MPGFACSRQMLNEGWDQEGRELVLSYVLVADDEPHIARVLRLGLEKAGYRVKCAHDGEQALKALRQEMPIALLTDIQMPVMSGKTLCMNIQAEYDKRNFPIYVFSSKASLSDREWTQEIDDLDFIEKPFSLKQIVQTLDARLGRNSERSNEYNAC